MQVFKTYFKIVKKNLTSLLIYFFVFVAISILMTNQGSSMTDVSGFSETKSKIAIFNYDNNSNLSNSLVSYLTKNNEIIELTDEKEVIQDAIYFRKVEYIVRIPLNFEKEFKEGKLVNVERISVPNSTSAMYLDMMVNRFLNSANRYFVNMPNITNEELNTNMTEDMSSTVKTEIVKVDNKNQDSMIKYYFNFFAYAIFAIITLGVTSIILTFNDKEIKKRNTASSVKLKSYNFQIILASFTFTIIVWALICTIALVIYGFNSFGITYLMYCINSFVISMVALSVSFLLSNIMKNKGAIDAISNILSLGLSFLSGVFVPQEVMSAEVLKIASFTPTYWYVKATETITRVSEFNFENLKPILGYMGVELLFAIAILIISLVVIKNKRSSKQL